MHTQITEGPHRVRARHTRTGAGSDTATALHLLRLIDTRHADQHSTAHERAHRTRGIGDAGRTSHHPAARNCKRRTRRPHARRGTQRPTSRAIGGEACAQRRRRKSAAGARTQRAERGEAIAWARRTHREGMTRSQQARRRNAAAINMHDDLRPQTHDDMAENARGHVERRRDRRAENCRRHAREKRHPPPQIASTRCARQVGMDGQVEIICICAWCSTCRRTSETRASVRDAGGISGRDTRTGGGKASRLSYKNHARLLTGRGSSASPIGRRELHR